MIARSVASAVFQALIMKLTPAVTVPIVSIPSAAAPVAPTVCLVNIIIEPAVTEVVAIVAVPPTRVTLPKLFAPAAVVVAVEVDMILLPAVPKTTLPFVAVIAPRVAVIDVVAVKAPACVSVKALLVPTAVLFEITNRSDAELSSPRVIVDAPTPLISNLRYGSPDDAPPVAISTPALDAPDVLSELVTSIATSAAAADLDRTMSPPETRIPPVVTVRPVPTRTVLVASNDPGAIRVDGKLHVIVPGVPVVSISLAVPRTSILPPTGTMAPPASPVRDTTAPTVPDPRVIQDVPENWYDASLVLSSHS